MIVPIILFALVVYIHFVWTRRRMYELSKNVPGFHKSLPFFGDMHRFYGDTHDLLNLLDDVCKISSENGGVGKFWFGPLLYYVITNPEDAAVVNHNCLEKDSIYRFGKVLLGNGLVTGPASTWRNHIKKISPAFNQTVLNRFMVVFNSQSRILASKLNKEVGNGLFNTEKYLSPFLLETLCQTTMGLPDDGQSVVSEQLMENINTVLELLAKRTITPYMHSDLIYYLLPEGRLQMKSIKKIHDFTDRVLRRKKLILANRDSDIQNGDTTKFKAFLELLLENNNGELTDAEIRDEIDTMIVAGQETTLSSMIMLFICLGSYQQVQEKLYNEMIDVLGIEYRSVDKDDLNKLVYTEAVIREVLRLYPPIPTVGRRATTEVKLRNYTIPAGAGIMVASWGLNRSKHIWGPDALDFRPERWLAPEYKYQPCVFATFSFGRRSCIGKQYAMMSMKTTLCNVIRKFRIISDISKLRLNLDTTLKITKGNLVHIEHRN